MASTTGSTPNSKARRTSPRTPCRPGGQRGRSGGDGAQERDESTAFLENSARSTGSHDHELARLFGQMQSQMQGMQGAIQSHIDSRFNEVGNRMDAIEGKLAEDRASQAGEMESIKRRLERLEGISALPEIPAEKREQERRALEQPGPADPHDFDRTIIRINTQNLVAKSVIEAFAAEVARGIGLDESHWKLRGGALARNYTLAFNGDQATAARRAKKALDA